MSQEINTREEAVQYLKSLGYTAKTRDWVLGKTIAVPIGKKSLIWEKTETNEKQYGWQGMLYLYPLESGEWAINDSRDLRNDRDKKYKSLQEAIMVAEKIVREMNTDLE
jgi:hypothetical protein